VGPHFDLNQVATAQFMRAMRPPNGLGILTQATRIFEPTRGSRKAAGRGYQLRDARQTPGVGSNPVESSNISGYATILRGDPITLRGSSEVIWPPDGAPGPTLPDRCYSR
jgi:hypothetical protein